MIPRSWGVEVTFHLCQWQSFSLKLSLSTCHCCPFSLTGFISCWTSSLFLHISTGLSHDCHTWQSFIDILVIAESLRKNNNHFSLFLETSCPYLLTSGLSHLPCHFGHAPLLPPYYWTLFCFPTVAFLLGYSEKLHIFLLVMQTILGFIYTFCLSFSSQIIPWAIVEV